MRKWCLCPCPRDVGTTDSSGIDIGCSQAPLAAPPIPIGPSLLTCDGLHMTQCQGYTSALPARSHTVNSPEAFLHHLAAGAFTKIGIHDNNTLCINEILPFIKPHVLLLSLSFFITFFLSSFYFCRNKLLTWVEWSTERLRFIVLTKPLALLWLWLWLRNYRMWTIPDQKHGWLCHL